MTSRGPDRPLADLRGGLRLAVDGTRGVARLVEHMHHTVLRRPGPLGKTVEGSTRGITGLVYRAVSGGAALVGAGLDALIAPFEGLLPPRPSARRDAMVAALNGVLGDHLEASGNPLAIAMQFRQGGRPLDLAAPVLGAPAGDRLLVLVHGLCMSDLGWQRDGHDHGARLARDGGYAAVYLYYNTGRHISTNGRELADRLEQLLRDWPLPLRELVIVGHSMGGLVARSACHYAEAAGLGWRRKLSRLVFLGTPHHGAPLERAGNWLHRAMDLSPYVAPFTRLSGLRSAGITDLRHGNLLDEDWRDADRFVRGDHRRPVPLPAGVQAYAIASTAGSASLAGSMLGDGLVPVASALGQHRLLGRDLGLPKSRQWLGHGIHHLDLLSSPQVYRRLRRWLK